MNPLTPSRQTTAPVSAITLTSYGSLEQMFKVADYLAKSSIVPQNFRNQPGSVLIALNMASRLRLDPFMVMQNIYDVHGRPGMSGQFAIALLNRSPKYSRIEYRYINGKDVADGMQVIGHRRDDPDDKAPDIGTPITNEMIKAEGWEKNPKWFSMRDQMLRYRSAAFFARAYCPEELMGMQTVDELEDTQIAMRDVTPRKHESGGVDKPELLQEKDTPGSQDTIPLAISKESPLFGRMM